MVPNNFLTRRRRRSRLSSYRPAVLLLEDRSVPSFLGPASYTVRGGTGNVAVGDFTGNGIADLAVVNYGSGDVSILLGRGDGTFRDAVSYATGVNPASVVVGDFNGDGIPDLAVADGAGSTVSVLLGNGDGSFRPPASYACGARPVRLVAGDFNGDGILDLAVANWDFVGSDSRGSVHVLLGNGDGSFQLPATYAAGILPIALVEGDFNGDGILDLAVANEGTGTGTDSSISVLKGVGDGSFLPAVDNVPGLRAQSLAIGDLTGNGLPDLIVGRSASTLVTVLRNRGDGSFVAAGDFTAGGDPSDIVSGDFTGHGIPDLAVGSDLRHTLSILPGNGDGTFGLPLSYAAGEFPGGLATGDFNGDGALDLVVGNTPDSLSVFLNRGDGTLLASVEMYPGTGPVVGGDFNGDGITDLVAPNFDRPGTISVLLGNGDGTFQPPVRYAVGPDPEAVVVGDFNGDGIPDIAVADTNGPSGNNGMVSILLGRSDGTFLPAVDYPVGGLPRLLVVGDFNGDGIPDIATYVGGSISVLLGRGDGTFLPAVTTPFQLSPLYLAAGDFNGDGVSDLVFVSPGGPPDYISTVSILLGNGDGTFRAPTIYTAEMRSGFVAVGDFNGDGVPDLAVANYSAGTVGIWLGNGDGTFQPPVDYAAGGTPRFVAVADFNGDGIPDLAVSGANAISILLGRGDGSFAPLLSYVGGYAPSPLVVGDFNGGGLPDIAAANQGGLIVLPNAGDWGPGAPAVRPESRARPRTHILSRPAAAALSVGQLAIPAADGDPQAALRGAATIRAPQSSPPWATGTTDPHWLIPPRFVATPRLDLPRRSLGDISSLDWNNAVFDRSSDATGTGLALSGTA